MGRTASSPPWIPARPPEAQMNTLLRWAVAVGKHQSANLRTLLTGRPVLQPGFAGRTLAQADVELAEQWLDQREAWEDDATSRSYECKFAEFVGASRAFSFRSGRESLSACLRALRLDPGSEVILPGFTCIVVANAVEFEGLVPVFADIELETFGLDVDSVRQRITPRTRAIIVQHSFGLVCRDYVDLVELARSKGIRVIEDCAHATGAKFRERSVGRMGDLAFFSSEQSKALCTVMGGMAVTDDEQLAQRIDDVQQDWPYPEPTWTERALRSVPLLYNSNFGSRRQRRGGAVGLRYRDQLLISTTEEEVHGRQPTDYGRRLPAPLASLGRRQLEALPCINSKRRRAARNWDEWCGEWGLKSPRVVVGSEPIFLRYPVLVDPAQKRDLRWAQRDLGFRPGVWFISHLHPSPRPVPDCPRAEEAVAGTINLPTLL